ncbi:MAG TPA: hypothetical protein VIF37_06395 [Methylobacter sp.]
MKNLNKTLKAFWQEETGLTMVEYAVAGSLVTLACAASFTSLGGAISTAITGMIGRMTPAT